MVGNPFEPEQAELCSRPALRPVKVTRVFPSSVCAYDKLTGKLLAVCESESEAAERFGLTLRSVEYQADASGFGHGWVAFRRGMEPLWGHGCSSTNLPVVIADDGLRVAFSSVQVAADALGIDYDKLHHYVSNGRRFEYCGRECLGIKLHHATGAKVVSKDEAYGLVAAGKPLGSVVIRWCD